MWHDCVFEGQARRLPERAALCRLDSFPGVDLYIEDTDNDAPEVATVAR